MNSNIRNCIKNYFKRNLYEDWEYKSFYKFMKILGYDNNDSIFRIYIRTIKDFINEETDEHKKRIANKLLLNVEIEEIKIREIEIYGIMNKNNEIEKVKDIKYFLLMVYYGDEKRIDDISVLFFEKWLSEILRTDPLYKWHNG